MKSETKLLIASILLSSLISFITGYSIAYRAVNDAWKEQTKYFHGNPQGKNLDDDPDHADKP